MSIAPIVRTVVVKARPARAFELFANHMEQWWPKGRTIGKSPHVAIVVEPHAGGRWFERDALVEKGASFRLSPVIPGTLKVEPHVSRHPFGRVPVLEHDGFMLYETQAIMRYLDRVVSGAALTPTDAKEAARMDQVMNVCDWYLFQGVGTVIGFQRVVGPKLLGLQTDEAAIAQAMPKAHAVFSELSRLLGTNAWFAGERLSLADLMTAAHIDFFVETPEWAPLTAATPNLVSWLARMNERACMKQTTWERVAQMATGTAEAA